MNFLWPEMLWGLALLPALATHLAPGGWAALAGILGDPAPEVRRAVRAARPSAPPR